MPRGVKAPTSQPGQTRLYIPRLNPSMLRHMVEDYGGMDLAAKDLRISRELLSRWTTGELEPPYSVLLAIFWQSPHGFKEAFNQSHWTHQYNSFLKNEAVRRVAVLEHALHAAGLPLPAGQITGYAQQLGAGPEPLEGYERYAVSEPLALRTTGGPQVTE